ncbi:MAG: (2Fe-2S)-binding protein [Rhodospirillales bacterium]|nr:(2Fe-2S)-binding protein [Rhodospirillales bacterium]
MSSNERAVAFRLNGEAVAAEAPVRMHAADFLRHRLGWTGTHVGCEQGVCGMCTILVDGAAIKSCLMLAVQLDGTAVRTVEALADGDRLNAAQEAFKRHHALQCGYCTPGFLMLAESLKAGGRTLSRAEIREELAGVLCRCTGYENILRAVEDYLGADESEASP